MIRVTWSWLGQGPALDLADTVTIEAGSEHDLLARPDEFRKWAEIESTLVPGASVALFERNRNGLMTLRTAVREALAAASAGTRPPKRSITELNRVSRAAPEWVELDPEALSVRRRSPANAGESLLAGFARSAIELIATHGDRLQRCPAPSCGMFYVSTRPAQRWCSTQCGSRARVARHYKRQKNSRTRPSGRS